MLQESFDGEESLPEEVPELEPEGEEVIFTAEAESSSLEGSSCSMIGMLSFLQGMDPDLLPTVEVPEMLGAKLPP